MTHASIHCLKLITVRSYNFLLKWFNSADVFVELCECCNRKVIISTNGNSQFGLHLNKVYQIW